MWRLQQHLVGWGVCSESKHALRLKRLLELLTLRKLPGHFPWIMRVTDVGKERGDFVGTCWEASGTLGVHLSPRWGLE